MPHPRIETHCCAFELNIPKEVLGSESEQNLGLQALERLCAASTIDAFALPPEPARRAHHLYMRGLELDRRGEPSRIVHRRIARDEYPLILIYADSKEEGYSLPSASDVKMMSDAELTAILHLESMLVLGAAILEILVRRERVTDEINDLPGGRENADLERRKTRIGWGDNPGAACLKRFDYQVDDLVSTDVVALQVPSPQAL